MDLSTIIDEARSGGTAAQKYLFELLAPKSLMLCRRYLDDAPEAEELMLNGLFKFFKSLNNFRYQHEGALFKYVLKIMENECAMFYRKENPLCPVPGIYLEEFPASEEIYSRISCQELHQLISSLPVGYRTVFNLVGVELWSYPEVSKKLGITEATCRSQFYKARLALQKLILLNEQANGKRETNE